MVLLNAGALLSLLAAVAVFADNFDCGDSTTVDVDLDIDVAPAVDAASVPTTITVINATQVNAFTPYTYYASAGYCSPSVTKTWTCGAACTANPEFKPIASGGHGLNIQFCL